MARALKTKLPRSYYKRARPTNLPGVRHNDPDTYSETFILGGPRTVASSPRQAFWANTFAKDILDVSRLTHMEATVQNWNHYYAQGRLGGNGERIAIIVDGSVSRPITHVKVFGQIAMVEAPRENIQTILAVGDALEAWRQAAPVLKGDYLANLHVFADNAVWVDPSLFMDRSGQERLLELAGQTNEPPFYTIINTMPYAAKVERDNLPSGVGYHAWKTVRGKYGNELALRFRYYTDDVVPIAAFQETSSKGKRTTVTKGGGTDSRTRLPKGKDGKSKRRNENYKEAGRPLSFPAINIGPPGSFNSGASKIIYKAALQK